MNVVFPRPVHLVPTANVTPWAFFSALSTIVLRAVTGPIFDSSDVAPNERLGNRVRQFSVMDTFLMVFLTRGTAGSYRRSATRRR